VTGTFCLSVGKKIGRTDHPAVKPDNQRRGRRFTGVSILVARL